MFRTYKDELSPTDVRDYIKKHSALIGRYVNLQDYYLGKHLILENGAADKDNHCITGDTLVDTEFGQIPIERLVGTTGRVYAYNFDTNAKDLLEFEDVRKTRKNAAVYEVELENGAKIKATKDHLFLTENGWVELQNLSENDSIINVFY